MATTKTTQVTKDLEVKATNKKATIEALQKFGKQETKEVEGVEYVFQYPGTRMAQQILDRAKTVGGGFSDEAYNKQIMDSVIVSPKTDWDYWDAHLGYREVMAFADNFLGRMLK